MLATVGPGASQVGVLLIDPIGQGAVTLTGLPPKLVVRVQESTAAEQGKGSRMTVDAEGRLTVPVPARSVVSVQTFSVVR